MATGVVKKKKQEAGNSDVKTGSRHKGTECMQSAVCLSGNSKHVVFCQMV